MHFLYSPSCFYWTIFFIHPIRGELEYINHNLLALGGTMPTIEQIRAARALIGWSQGELADHAGLSQTGIARIENGTNHPNSGTLAKIIGAFDSVDVEFIGDSGVKKRTSEVRTLRGAEGFRAFMDDVYHVASTQGGQIVLHSADPANWIKWLGEDFYVSHVKRMAALGNKINVRITVEEGNENFIASSFAEYRWFSYDIFREESFYAYGDRLAFMSFTEKDVVIQILTKSEFAEGFRVLFNIAWDNVAVSGNKK